MTESTKHLVIDLKTGYAYGIQLSAEGKCEKVQPFNSSIQTLDTRREIDLFGPLVGFDNPFKVPPPVTIDALPYGQTTVAIELRKDGKKGEIFTIVWPTKDDAEKGAYPLVARKELPEDILKTGIAPLPKEIKGKKGAGVEDEEMLNDALKNIDDMIGLDAAKSDIKKNIAVARFNRIREEMGLSTKPISRHMVFTGNPGTGKTTFAREVAKVYHALGFIDKAVVHEVKREDLVAGFVGQTALKTKEAIDKAKGGILFIDEAYALSREAGASDSKDFGREAIDTLVAAMENMRDDLIVIVAGYTEPMKQFIDANPGLKSRFMTYINFDDYNTPQLTQIMDFMLKERGYTMTQEAREFAIKMLEDERARANKIGTNAKNLTQILDLVVSDTGSPLSDELRAHTKKLLTEEKQRTDKSEGDGHMKQLCQIMEMVVQDRVYPMSTELRMHAIRIIEDERRTGGSRKDFGNGRTVRNLVEKAEKELALRLQDEKKLSRNHGLSEEEIKKALTEITLDDVKKISLAGISQKQQPEPLPLPNMAKNLGAKISFGEKAAKNDNAPPPASIDAPPAVQFKEKAPRIKR